MPAHSYDNSFNGGNLRNALSRFQVITQESHRPTKDLDFLGFGSNDEAFLREEFSEIIKVPIDDGLIFNDISSSILQKGGKYQGVRLDIKGEFADTPVKGQVDIGFGSVIYRRCN